jgi:hypothetical protein
VDIRLDLLGHEKRRAQACDRRAPPTNADGASLEGAPLRLISLADPLDGPPLKGDGRSIDLDSVRAVRPQDGSLLRRLAVVAVVTVVVFAQAGLVLAPSQLASHPMLVLALRPTPAFLVLVSGSIFPLTAIAVAAAGRTMVDVAYFAMTRFGALPLVQRFGIGRDASRGLSRTTTTRGLLTLLFFWSSTPVIVALGLGRTTTRTFVAVTGLGNVVTSAAFVFFGRQLSDQIAPFSAWISAHSAWLTGAIAMAVIASVLIALRSGRRGSRDEVERDAGTTAASANRRR